MQCDALRDDMLDVLYGEAEPSAVRRVEEHQRSCAGCRDEALALRKVRKDLAAWRLPRSNGVARPGGLFPRWLRPWAVAAALPLAVAGGLALAGAELRVEDGSVLLRVGPGPRAGDVRALLAEQESRHRREIDHLRSSLARGPQGDQESLLRRVNEMIRESESRQAGLIGSRLAEYHDAVDTQRRLDRAWITAGLSYLDEKTGEHVARTNELMGRVLQASQKR